MNDLDFRNNMWIIIFYTKKIMAKKYLNSRKFG